MPRGLLPLVLVACAICSCEEPVGGFAQDESASAAEPAATAFKTYVYEDPRTAVWQVFEGNDFQPLVQAIPGGAIDWTSGSVLIEGRGLARGGTPQDGLMARRAARVMAARNALLAVGGIPVGSGGSFRHVQNGTIRLDGHLRDFQEVRGEFDPAKRTAVSTVRLPIYGARGVVQLAGLTLCRPARSWTWPAATRGEPEARLVVVHVRGAMKPALLPRFLTPGGECVFDAAELSEEELAWRPAATYVRFVGLSNDEPAVLKPGPTPIRVDPAEDVTFARSVGRAFGRSVLLTGAPAGADKPGTVSLSASSVEYLRAHPETRRLLLTGKVVIVTE